MLSYCVLKKKISQRKCWSGNCLGQALSKVRYHPELEKFLMVLKC